MTNAPHHDDRGRESPAARFDATATSFDLAAELASLRHEPSPARHGHRQKTLLKVAGRTIALFSLDEGASLPEHAANGAVTVQPIEGELEVTVDGATSVLTPGQLLAMAPKVRHAVRARVPAAFLLQVSVASG